MQHHTQPLESLIKYETQIEISQNAQQYKKQKHSLRSLESKPSAEDVLNAIIPPREWATEANKLYLQYVSHQNASRENVLQLKQLLEQRLKERQARQSGICPIRQQLFSQCFDEIIRQVTIDCPQRGLLLMRVRDQLKMTIAAYQTLYQSSVSFGIRKQVQSQEGKSEMQLQMNELQKHKNDLEQKKIELISKKQSLQKKIAERSLIQKQKRQEELSSLASQADHLSKFLESIKGENLSK